MRPATPSERALIAADAAQGQPLDFSTLHDLDVWLDDAEFDLRRELAEEIREGKW